MLEEGCCHGWGFLKNLFHIVMQTFDTTFCPTFLFRIRTPPMGGMGIIDVRHDSWNFCYWYTIGLVSVLVGMRFAPFRGKSTQDGCGHKRKDKE